MAVKVVCPNCGTEMLTSSGAFATPVTTEQNGVATLVAKEIHNNNISKSDKVNQRMAVLKAAGINVDKLGELMDGNSSFKDLFEADDPILESIGKGGFIHNPELFRRWITAQTMRLLKDPSGWTHAVRKTYDIVYIFNQTKRELALLCKLQRKCPDDIRFQFFTLYDLKAIFADLTSYVIEYYLGYGNIQASTVKNAINNAYTYNDLYAVIDTYKFKFRRSEKHVPRNWLNCFKGAGAYYTLQNLIRTHELVLPNCKDMNESLNMVEHWFKKITNYAPGDRRWDIMLSLLTKAVVKTNFELKY